MTDEATIRRDAGEMLVVGFEGADTEPPEAVARALEAGELGGVILFTRNFDSLEQVVALNRRIHELAADAELPPFVAIDQEGGPVMRIREGLTEVPAMREVGDRGDPEYVADVSKVLARELRALGFNLNFAPVLDVDTNPDNPVIGDRAFSDDPEEVARAAGAYLFGHNAAGVVPCGKHFPGHGDTDRDSHEELPVLAHDPDRLREVELRPFEAAIQAGVPMLMTAHMLVPALDALRPATFSPALLDDLLRDELQFDGVVVTDDLEMRAVADRYDIPEMVDLGLAASVDLFLVCHTETRWRDARDQLVERALQEEAVADRVARSAERIRALKRDYFGHQTHPWEPSQNWRDVLGTEQHRALVAPSQ